MVAVTTVVTPSPETRRRFGHRKISLGAVHFMRHQLLAWGLKSRRDFPWRSKDATLYHQVVSEVLLQRTKADTVAAYWPNFIKHFPAWAAIAQASPKQLERILQPIGLAKQRAPRLHALAQIISQRHDEFPLARAEIEMLPGVGQYIANAILTFHQHKPAPLMDVNMARVIERFFGPRKLADIRYDPFLQELATALIDDKHGRLLNWTILDFAALICKARQPKCGECVLQLRCASCKQGARKTSAK